MDITKLASRIKLVTLNTGAWRAVKLHKAETLEENQRHGLKDQARVSVRICEHKALVDLNKLHMAAYQEHRRLTLPSIQDGMRVVPCGREFEHSKAMAAFKAQHQTLVAEFLQDYEVERHAAEMRLNGLYDPRFFPSKDAVESKFKFSFQYLGCPTDGSWADWLQESAQAGQGELRNRLVGAARHLADVCAKDGGKFYQSVLDNLSDICSLAGDFNLMDDPIIAQAAQQLAPLAAESVETLREDKAHREDIGKRTAAILNVFGGVS